MILHLLSVVFNGRLWRLFVAARLLHLFTCVVRVPCFPVVRSSEYKILYNCFPLFQAAAPATLETPTLQDVEAAAAAAAATAAVGVAAGRANVGVTAAAITAAAAAAAGAGGGGGGSKSQKKSGADAWASDDEAEDSDGDEWRRVVLAFDEMSTTKQAPER